MDNLEIVVNNVEERINSLELATLCNKQHKHVMRDIKKMEPAYIEVFGAGSKFGLGNYKDANNQSRPCYLLTKSQSLFVVSAYNATIRAMVQKRWEELETKEQDHYKILPRNYKEALLQLVASEEEKEALIASNKQKDFEIFNLTAPKYRYSMLEASKSIGIGRNALYAALKARHHILLNNTPSQVMINRGYMGYKYCEEYATYATYITPKGLIWLNKHIGDILDIATGVKDKRNNK